MAKVKAPKVYKVKISRSSISRSSERFTEGTLEELTEYFGYTLEVGNSWNSKINTKPKTIKSLISNVQKSFDIINGNTYTTETVELVSEWELKWEI